MRVPFDLLPTSELESALINAVDELVSDTMISDETWAVLALHLSTKRAAGAAESSWGLAFK